MVEPRNCGRPWTAEEDALLTESVRRHGELDMWKTIALAVPGRTNKACRKRWLHSLSPTIKKSAWTPDEDMRLRQLYIEYGPKWSAIARHIDGRTDDACSKRYREALDPSLKKDDWSAEEDAKLHEVYERVGGKWVTVGQELKRSALGCRNRWRLLARKQAAMQTKETCIDSSAAVETEIPASSEPLEQQSSMPQSHWSYPEPYFPPGDYSHYAGEGSQLSGSFQDSMPPYEPSPMTPIDFPPFQSSSSSLSAALSAPPPVPKPLPNLNADMSDIAYESPSYLRRHSEPISCGLPSSQDAASANTVLLLIPSPSATGWPSTLHEPNPSHNLYNPYLPEMSGWDSSPQLSQSEHLFMWSQHSTSSPSPSTQHSVVSNFIDLQQCTNNSASDTSTPLASLSLSPISSPPNSVSSIDLPTLSSNPSQESILFSSQNNPSGSQPRTLRSKGHSTVINIHDDDQASTKLLKDRRRRIDPGSFRLSSNLPVTSDPFILPYACGHDKCWPADVPASRVCFATSKELTEHNKSEHPGKPSDRPYRCALSGCGKSWKNINGLQYHLQVSAAHFRHALLSSSLPSESTDDLNTSLERNLDDQTKKFACDQPRCSKVYRQLSGLRYHLLHGHPTSLPAQLEVVPPTLARQIADKVVKRRTIAQRPA